MSQTHVRPDDGSGRSTPLWVKVGGIVMIVFLLLFGLLHVTGNSLGGHDDHTPALQQSVQP